MTRSRHFTALRPLLLLLSTRLHAEVKFRLSFGRRARLVLRDAAALSLSFFFFFFFFSFLIEGVRGRNRESEKLNRNEFSSEMAISRY
jgi:hypothetical protein